FRSHLSPAPKYVLHTGAAHVEVLSIRPADTWSAMQDVSNDGEQVTIVIGEGDFRFPHMRMERWDTIRGLNTTPALWHDKGWQEILSLASWNSPNLMELHNPALGREFLADEAALSSLHERLKVARINALNDLRKTMRPVQDSEARSIYPESCCFSTDGKYFAY